MRRSSRKKSRAGVFVALLLLLLAVLVGYGGFFTLRYYIDNRMPAFRMAGVVMVHPESGVEDVIAEIKANLAPRDTASVRRTLCLELSDHRLVPGMYSFSTQHTARFMARSITRGWQQTVEVVIAGRLRSSADVADRLAMYMMAGSKDFQRVFSDSLLLAKYGTTPSSLMELVIPDTYQIYWTASPEEVVARLKREHDLYWTQERISLARAQGLSPYQVSVLASIVCEESSVRSELPKIAGVYLNRLYRGMPLQACPTICYIYGYTLRRVLYRHLKTESPYNTYIHPGLPPTPICVPTKESLEAVLHPDKGKYLFFCASAELDGTNVFATTLAEHNRNAAAYAEALDRLRRSKDAAADSLSLPPVVEAADAGQSAVKRTETGKKGSTDRS